MSKLKERKIVLIGSGAVGTSFLYSAINRGLAQRYEIIDLSKEVVAGNVMDIEDAIATSEIPFTIGKGSYDSCEDADIIVITAGRPHRLGETRLDMVEDNAEIMKNIALKIKKSRFDGITIIASNPVDIMTHIYQKVTGFNHQKVIGSGTSLDSARLRLELAKRLNIAPQSIQAYVLGEHGDSSVSIFSSATAGGKSILKIVSQNLIAESEFVQIHEYVQKKASEIIRLKKATFYGIGSALSEIVASVLFNKRLLQPAGAFLQGEYGQAGFYTGVPCIIGSDGIQKVVEIEMNAQEKVQFNKSCETLKIAITRAEKAIV